MRGRPVISVILRLVVIGVLASCLGFALLASWLGYPWLAIVLPLLVASLYFGGLAVEFLWLYRSFGSADGIRPARLVLARALLAECRVSPMVFFGRQPFRCNSYPDAPCAVATKFRGVLLVHGFFCNRGIWNPWLRQFYRSGRAFSAVDLEPVFGPIDAYVETIDAAARKLRHATGKRVVVVAHSMGGVAVRAWLASRDAGDLVHHVVTIATPHGGTRMASRSHSANATQMAIGSAWLTALSAAESNQTGRVSRTPVTCFWSECDNIVFPVRAATLVGADNIRLGGVPHVAMVYHPTVLDTVTKLALEPD